MVWKLVQNKRNIKSWEKITGREGIFDKKTLVQVFKDDSHSPPYRFTVHWDSKIQIDKQFDSMARAMNSAKKWMREHPNG